ncbi:MAG: M23 family metallopeptidase [Oscillospiraceae bacterium]|nr:M23 family metallopeptidase [Oscillospiraceae bacterium]
MKRHVLTVAAALVALAAVLKILAPGLPERLREAMGLPAREAVYLDALEAIGARIAPEAAPGEAVWRYEEAEIAGEFAPEPSHPAVAAFLERQGDFAGYAPPEHVDYGWYELPFAAVSPVEDAVCSGFGYRLHPILGEVKFHYGSDFAASAGTDIAALADGTVRFAGSSDSFGNYVTIDHAGGWSSLYAHCSYLYVHTGQSVSAGEKIALVGATGHVTGPHLHFELQRDGVYRNPEYCIGN